MDITSFFQNLVTGSATNLQLMPEFANNFLDNCYNDYDSATVQNAGPGYSLTMNIPKVDEGDVTDIGASGIALSNFDSTPVTITNTHKFSVSKPIQSFDMARTPVELADQVMAPMVESAMRKVNRFLATLAILGYAPPSASATGLVLPGSAPGAPPTLPTGVNPKITGPTSPNPAFSRLNFAQCWNTMVNVGAPGTNLRAFLSPTPYSNMMGDETNKFLQNYIVGAEAATSLQQTAKFMPQFGAVLDYDQHCTTLGATGTFGGVFYHKKSIAFKPFTEPVVKGTFVKQFVFFPTKGKTVPFTAQLWHDPAKQALILHVFVCLGAKVVRPEWGIYLETAPAGPYPAATTAPASLTV